MPNPIHNIDASVAGCQHEAAIQTETAASLDAKLMGILAFMVAAAGVLLTVAHGTNSYRWILLVGAAGSIVITLLSLVVTDGTEAGPDPIDFYKKYGAAPPEDFSEQLIADFEGMLGGNKTVIKEREAMVGAAFGWAVLAGLAFGLARALVAILA